MAPFRFINGDYYRHFILLHNVSGIEQQIGERALSIAETTADRPDIRAGFGQSNPSETLQPIAEAVRL